MQKVIAIIFIAILVGPVAGYTYPLSFQRVDGEIIELQEYKGKYIVLEIMTTWCEVCQAEMEELKLVYANIKNDVVMISIGVDLKSDTLEKLEQYRIDYGVSWIFGLDHKEAFKSTFNVDNYPTIILLAGSGNILKKWTGLTYADVILDEIDNYVDIEYTIQQDQGINFVQLLNDNLMMPIFVFLTGLILIYKVYTFINNRSTPK